MILRNCFFLLMVIIATSCASMKESVKARKMLEKCGYALTEVQLDLIDFKPTIAFDNSAKKINVDNPGKEVLALAKEIKNRNFSIDLSKVYFNAIIEITNPNDVEVALDSLKLKTYLDDAFLVDVRHLEHTVIPPNSSAFTTLNVALPTAFPVKSLLVAEDMVLKGKVWLNLNLTKNTNITLPIPVSFRKEIPREEINQAIEDEKDERISELMEYISTQGINKLKKRMKGKL